MNAGPLTSSAAGRTPRLGRSARALAALAVLAVLAGCPSGRDKLLADLQSTRPEERALAVKKLAELGHAEDVNIFAQLAKDPVTIVRAEAVTALGKSQDARVVDLLGEALEDSDPMVQERAAQALAAVKTDKARAYLSLMFGRQGRSTRLAIVQGLKAANVPGAMATVVAAEAKSIWERNLKTLEEGAPPEKVGAAEALGRSGRPEAVNRLLPLLKEKQVMLAAAGVRGLAIAGDARAVAPIAALLAENDPDLRGEACEALAAFKDPSVLSRLRVVALEKSPTSPLATRAIVALGKGEEADKALCEVVVGGAEAEVQVAGREMRARGGCPLEPLGQRLAMQATAAQALRAIAALGPSAAALAPKVLPHLGSSDRGVRHAAVEALAELGDAGQAPALLKAYDAELKLLDAFRADWVKEPLPREFQKGFNPAAPSAGDDPNLKERLKQQELMAKVHALNVARAADAGRVLIEPVPPSEVVDDANDEQLKVLAALVRALGRLKAQGALEKLSVWAQDGNAMLRTAALVGLASLGPQGAERARGGLLESDRSVLGVVAQALADAGPEAQLSLIDTLRKRTSERARLLEPLDGQVLPASATPALIALVSEGGLEAGSAALLLAEQGSKEAVAPLLEALDDDTLVARREILKALGRLKDKSAIDKVARDLYHESPEVRAAAAEALGLLGGAGEHHDALDALKSDYYRRVRDAAAQALGRIGAEGGKR